MPECPPPGEHGAARPASAEHPRGVQRLPGWVILEEDADTMKISRPARRRLLIAAPIVLVVAVVGVGSIPRGPLVITPPPADGDAQRWVHVEGAANTRDAGGYPTADGGFVKRGMIYRSAKLNRLSPAGEDTYRKLGITTVIDFCNRLTPWPLFGGDVWAVQLASKVRGCPMSFRSDVPKDQFYVQGIPENAEAYREAFDILADPGSYPVLYHCAGGTDRTGVMSALLLSRLGVDRDNILADFRLSEQVRKGGNVDALNGLFKAIDEAGGIEAYLERVVGVSRETQEAVWGNLRTSAESH